MSRIYGASYDHSLYEIHTVSHIWPISLPYNMKFEIERANRGHFQRARFHKLRTF